MVSQHCISPEGWRYGMLIEWDQTLHWTTVGSPANRKRGVRLETLCTLTQGPQPIDVMRWASYEIERVDCRECLELIHA